MVLIISTKQWLMLKDAIMLPRFFELRYSKDDRGKLNKMLNDAWEEQITNIKAEVKHEVAVNR